MTSSNHDASGDDSLSHNLLSSGGQPGEENSGLSPSNQRLGGDGGLPPTYSPIPTLHSPDRGPSPPMLQHRRGNQRGQGQGHEDYGRRGQEVAAGQEEVDGQNEGQQWKGQEADDDFRGFSKSLDCYRYRNKNHGSSQKHRDSLLSRSLTPKQNLGVSGDDNYVGVILDDAPILKKRGESGDDVVDPAMPRWRQRRLMLSVMVALLCYVTGMLALVLVQSQFVFQRIAVEYFNLTNVTKNQNVPCGTGRNDSLQDDLNTVQIKTSQKILSMEYAQFIPAIFVSLIAGSYADYLGRKYLVLVPLTGAFLKSLVYVLVITLEADVNYLYLAYLLDGLSGSFYVLLLGLSASIADVSTTSRQRVLLFALLEIVLAFAGSFSQIGTGFLINAFGFGVPAVVICSLMFVGSADILLFMPETLRKPDHIVLNPLVHLRKVFGFYFFDGTLLRRGVFGCGLMIFFFITMIMLGKQSVEMLFMMNTPFCWDSIKIGLFSGLRLLVQNLIGVLTLKMLSKWIRIEYIAVLGLLSGMASYAVEAFAVNDLMMFISAVVGVFIAVVSPISRTLLSRMAPANKQGALFASVSAIETVVHLTSTTIYNQVYTATLDVYPGAVFLVMVVLLVFCLFLLVLFWVLSHKMLFYEDLQEEINVSVEIARPPSTPTSTTDDESQPLLQQDTPPDTYTGSRDQGTSHL